MLRSYSKTIRWQKHLLQISKAPIGSSELILWWMRQHEKIRYDSRKDSYLSQINSTKTVLFQSPFGWFHLLGGGFCCCCFLGDQEEIIPKKYKDKLMFTPFGGKVYLKRMISVLSSHYMRILCYVANGIVRLFWSWALKETGKRTHIYQTLKINSGQFSGAVQGEQPHFNSISPATHMWESRSQPPSCQMSLPGMAEGDDPDDPGGGVRGWGVRASLFLPRRWE